MARKSLHGLRAAYAAKYPWYEQHRCCDQKYDLEDDVWTAEELEEWRDGLRDKQPLRWTVDLYFHNKKVGRLNVDPLKLFDAFAQDVRQHRHFAAQGRLSDEELESPLSEAELTNAAESVAVTLLELFHYGDIVEDAYVDGVRMAPALNRGPEGLIEVLEQIWDVEQLGSKRLLRALHAVGAANSFQKFFKANSHATQWQRDIRREQPHRLVPVGISTIALATKFRKILERFLEDGADKVCYRPSGRPRKVEPSIVRHNFRTTREQLSMFHARLKRLHAASARRGLLQEYANIAERLVAAGMVEGVIGGEYKKLETLVCTLIGSEMRISPQTARRYGRSSEKRSKSSKLKFTGEKKRS